MHHGTIMGTHHTVAVAQFIKTHGVICAYDCSFTKDSSPYLVISVVVKVTASKFPLVHYIIFTVRRFTWDPRAKWDHDLIITGHKEPGMTVTPVNMRIYQPRGCLHRFFSLYSEPI